MVEKLEAHSKVGFAVVLLTPDDVGRSVKDDKDRPRARQNVVLELGFFMGRLGRSNIAVMYDESVELPSDYRGVEYIKVDAEGAWRLRLAREIKQAGILVDMNKAI
jgi:predicted nucleotide-binding protein